MTRKLLIVASIFLLTIVGVLCINALNIFEENKNYQDYTNMPFTIRVQMNFALRRSDVVKQNGEPDESGYYNNFSYIIYYGKNDIKSFIFFNKITGVIHHSYNSDGILYVEDFRGIKEGISTEQDVQMIDRFLSIADLGNNKAISKHMICDSHMLKIEYVLIDDEWVVEQKLLIEDPSGMSKFIEDYFKKSNE